MISCCCIRPSGTIHPRTSIRLLRFTPSADAIDASADVLEQSARTIANGLALLLLPDGRRRQASDAGAITDQGRLPVLLVACWPPHAVMTTIGVEVEPGPISIHVPLMK